MTNNYETDDIPVVAEPVAETGPRVLPILPATELVLFPRLIMPLALWEEPAQKLVDEVLLKDKTLGFLTSKEEKPTGFDPDNFFNVGTAAVILKMRKADDDSVRLLIQGLYRFRVERWVGQDPYPGGRGDPHPGRIRALSRSGGPGLQCQGPLPEDAGALTLPALGTGEPGPGTERPPGAGRHHRRQPQHFQEGKAGTAGNH